MNCWEYMSNDRADFVWLWSDCTVLIRKPPQVIPGGGAHPLHPPPGSAPGGWCKPNDIVKKDRKETDPTRKKKTKPSQQRLSQHPNLAKSLVCDRVLNGLYFFVEFVPQQVFEWKWIRRRGNTARTWEKEKWKASRKVQPTSGVETQIKLVPLEITPFTIDIS